MIMKQADETVDVGQTKGLTRKIGPRGRYAAAYQSGHQTTVIVQVMPDVFAAMTPGDALAEANKIALNAGIDGIERTITINYLRDRDRPPKWRVSFILLVRQDGHEGNLQVDILSSETNLNE